MSVLTAIEVDGHKLVASLGVRHVNILSPHIDGRLQRGQCLGNLPSGVVAYLLANDVQAVWCDSENQPTAITIQKGTGGMHSIFQFTSAFLQFQRLRLTFGYQLLYIWYCHR